MGENIAKQKQVELRRIIENNEDKKKRVPETEKTELMNISKNDILKVF